MQKPRKRRDYYYLYSDESKIVYYSIRIPFDRPDLIFIGNSDNPNTAMAACAFMQNSKQSHGYRLKELTTKKVVKTKVKYRRSPKARKFKHIR